MYTYLTVHFDVVDPPGSEGLSVYLEEALGARVTATSVGTEICVDPELEVKLVHVVCQGRHPAGEPVRVGDKPTLLAGQPTMTSYKVLH